MKKLISFSLLLIFGISAVSAQTAKVKKDPVGNWKFEAPYAPEGFTSGNVTVALTEKKYSASLSFTGVDFKIPAENVKFENDTLSLTVHIEDETVNISMKMDDPSKMAGNAVYSGGSIPLTMARVNKEGE